MKKHKIRVKIEVVECEEEKTGEIGKIDDGEFEMVITPEQATSIDDFEQALLVTNYEAIRDAVRKHLSEVSKKKPSKRGEKEK
jgi:hypothetical protein